MKRIQCSSLVLACLLASGPSLSSAAITNLTSGNSSFDISDDTQAGAYNWYVDGVDHLYQEWFWYGIGNSAESSIDSLALSSSSTFLGTRGLQLNYSSAGLFDLELISILTGGTSGSGVSDMAQNISITNTSNSALDFRFYQYADFDLQGSSYGDTAQIVNPNTVQVIQPGYVISETVDTPSANHWEIGYYSATLTKLIDGVPTTLNDNNGPLTGDVTWAWEWDVTIDAGSSFLISKDMSIAPSEGGPPAGVPVPASLWLFVSGLLGVVRIARRPRRTMVV